MIPIIIFYFSGAVIVLLLSAKVWECKRERPLSFLSIISRGDARFRQFSHDATHTYSEWKERGAFLIKKQLPLRTRNIVNKSKVYVDKKTKKYLGDIRNTRLLHPKKDGISEFFKNISNAEKVVEEPPQTTEVFAVMEEETRVMDIPEVEVIDVPEVKPKRVVRRKKKI